MRAHIYNLVEEDMHPDPKKPIHNESKTLDIDQSADTHKHAISTSGPNISSAVTAGNSSSNHDTVSGEDESIALSLVQDLLDCMHLPYTSSVLKAELRQTYAQWPRRRIADVLQLDLDEQAASVTTTSTVSDATRTPPKSDKNEDADDDGHTDETAESKTSDSESPTTSASPSATVPLLVEILRRLPKTTDESSCTTATNKEDGEDSTATEADNINNDTFVASSRSAIHNITSESL